MFQSTTKSVAVGARGRMWLGGLAITLTCLAGAVCAHDGELDAQFGAGGVSIAMAAGSATALHVALAVQADDKVLVTGSVQSPGATFAVARIYADGTPDTTFATSGAFVLSAAPGVDTNIVPWKIMLQSDGKIVVGGSDDNGDMFVLRLNSDGSLDSSFGGTGFYQAHAERVDAISLSDFLVTADNNTVIVLGHNNVTGSSLAAIQATAASFSYTGQALPLIAGQTGITEYFSLARDAVGRIVIAGANASSGASPSVSSFCSITRYVATADTGGVVHFHHDDSFSDVSTTLGTYAIPAATPKACEILSVNSLASGNIEISGLQIDASYAYHGFAAGISESGLLPTLFADNNLFSAQNPFNDVYASLIQADGKILELGYNFLPGPSPWEVTQIERQTLDQSTIPASLQIDSQFGDDGVATVDLGDGNTAGVHSMALDRHGRILIGMPISRDANTFLGALRLQSDLIRASGFEAHE